MKIAIIHDHLTQIGGAEQVLKVFHEMFPEAPIYTLVFNEGKMNNLIPKEIIKTSFLQKLPWGVLRYQWYLSLMPTATESYDLTEFDVVLSSSSALAKGVITQSNTVHICYCHTPTRYLWSDTHMYLAGLRYPFFIKKIIPYVLNKLRIWDYSAAQRVDVFIANSKFVAMRIKKYYKRESTVIYPPVDTDAFSLGRGEGGYFLTGGRLVESKRFDLVVAAFNRLRMKLVIFGCGREERRLRAFAGPTISFTGYLSREARAKVFADASAFIYPQVEDFGITAVEAMVCGRPVIAYSHGGALETIIPNETGVFFHNQTWESLFDKLIHFNYENWDRAKIREHAKKFEANIFKMGIKKYVEDRFEEFKKGLSQQTLIGQ